MWGDREQRKMHLSRSEKEAPPLLHLLRPLLASMAAVRRKDELTRVKNTHKAEV